MPQWVFLRLHWLISWCLHILRWTNMTEAFIECRAQSIYAMKPRCANTPTHVAIKIISIIARYLKEIGFYFEFRVLLSKGVTKGISLMLRFGVNIEYVFESSSVWVSGYTTPYMHTLDRCPRTWGYRITRWIGQRWTFSIRVSALETNQSQAGSARYITVMS